MSGPQPRPWYREPWPWILMAGPAVVVVAGFATLAIAITTNDGLVADDYYRQGLAINRVIARDGKARELGLAATVQVSEARDRVRVLFTSGPRPAKAPLLTFVNATRAGLDQAVALHPTAPGVYEGPVRMPEQGLWTVHLEDADGAWRLAGEWGEHHDFVQLGARPR
ncbi:MAG TPA: FixH family protein [Usitatibacter sp.]|nr:FixH family protein [Usitatibacter sp.]